MQGCKEKRRYFYYLQKFKTQTKTRIIWQE